MSKNGTNQSPITNHQSSCSSDVNLMHVMSKYKPTRYIPLLWFDDQRVMDQASATTLQEEFLFFVDYAADTARKGWIASSALAMLGGVLWSVFMYFKIKHDRRMWVD